MLRDAVHDLCAGLSCLAFISAVALWGDALPYLF